jgi:hypothetical protein
MSLCHRVSFTPPKESGSERRRLRLRARTLGSRGASVAFTICAGLLVSLHPTQAVVGGGPAERAVVETLVMVLAEGGGACSGVVVAPRAVLTAGHCLPKGKQIRVYAPSPETPQDTPHLIVPSASAVHPAYVQNAVGARHRSVDLGLIRLPQALPAPFTPALLATSSAPGAGESIAVAGEGLSEEGVARSSGKPRSVSLSVVEPYGRGEILLWAAPAYGSPAGACEGDSGGAMLASTGSLLAVIAFAEGSGRAHCGKLTQGVLVAPQRVFIDATLAKWGEAARWTDR